jgi:hypothetical protein
MTAGPFFNKYTLSALICLLMVAGASCTKSTNSTIVNNIGTGKPTFSVNGISNLVVFNNTKYNNTVTRELTVQYLDSGQETVTLAISQLPGGITYDSVFWMNSGIPTFSTVLQLHNTMDTGAKPGSYPITITATTASGKTVLYPFTLFVQSYATDFLGDYEECTSPCKGSLKYTENVFADPAVRNKIWFSNFFNSGASAYGLLDGNGFMTFPAQVFGSDTLNSGTSSPILTDHQVFINAKINGMFCSMSLK